MSETPRLRWFEAYPKCGCGKVAHGILRGDGNESYGAHCHRCAEKRLKASEKERQRLADLLAHTHTGETDDPT